MKIPKSFSAVLILCSATPSWAANDQALQQTISEPLIKWMFTLGIVYNLYFDEEKNRETIQKNYGLLAYKPRMLVIIGRLGNVDPLALRTFELDTPQLTLRTYDDLLARMKERYVTIKHGDRRVRSFFR